MDDDTGRAPAQALRDAVDRLAAQPVDTLVEQLLHGMGADADDDIALLAVRMP